MNRIISPLFPADARRDRLFVIGVFAVNSLVGLAMLAARFWVSGRRGYAFLPWNLFLAWLPLAFAAAAVAVQTGRRGGRAAIVALGGLWLLFFPNAPYLLTEFKHLAPGGVSDQTLPDGVFRLCLDRPVPLWFDVLLVMTFAWNGLVLGFLSLYLVHRAVSARIGPAWGWAAAAGAVALGAFGITLGRFERWNSWDLLTRPHHLLADVFSRVADPLAHPRTAAATVGLAAFLLLAYLTLIALMRLHRGAVLREAGAPARRAMGSWGGLAVVACVAACAGTPRAAAAAADDDDDPKPLWLYAGGGSCAFSPDGRRVVATDGKVAVVLDAGTGKPVGEPCQHALAVRGVSFSPDGKRFVTADDDTARVWDPATGKPLTPPMRHNRGIFTAAFSPDGGRVVTAGMDKAARVWDVATGKPLLSLPHKVTVLSAAFSPDGKRVLTVGGGGRDDHAWVWDAETGATVVGPIGKGVVAAVFSPDGKRLATVEDHGARVWEADTGKLVAETEKHWGRMDSVTFSPDGKRLGTAGDGAVRVWAAGHRPAGHEAAGGRREWNARRCLQPRRPAAARGRRRRAGGRLGHRDRVGGGQGGRLRLLPGSRVQSRRDAVRRGRLQFQRERGRVGRMGDDRVGRAAAGEGEVGAGARGA